MSHCKEKGVDSNLLVLFVPKFYRAMIVSSVGFSWHKRRHFPCSIADLWGCDPMFAIKIKSIEQMGQSDAFAFMRH